MFIKRKHACFQLRIYKKLFKKRNNSLKKLIKMIIANSFNRAEAYVELGTEDGVVVIPTDKFIAVDDESGFISVKLIGSRKTAYVIPKEAYHKNPDEPDHYKVWGYLTDGSVYVVPENGDSSLSSSEVSPYKATMATANIGTGVTTIGSSAFFDLQTLTSVTIPNSVTKFNTACFYHCENIKSDLKLNENVTVEDRAFDGCGGGTLILNTNMIGNDCFSYSGFKNIIIGKNIEVIKPFLFLACSKLENITFQGNITEIGDSAFNSCTNLKSISLPNTVASIGVLSFAKCTSLVSITIPNSVTSIGNQAFRELNLDYFKSEAVVPPSAGSKIFLAGKQFPIYVPDESVDAYKAASEWSKYADRIKPISEYV